MKNSHRNSDSQPINICVLPSEKQIGLWLRGCMWQGQSCVECWAAGEDLSALQGFSFSWASEPCWPAGCWHGRATCTYWAKLMKTAWLYGNLSLWPTEHTELLVVNISITTLYNWPVTPLYLSWRFLTRRAYSLCLPQGNLILCIFNLLIWNCDVQGDQLSLDRSVYATSVSIFYAYFKIT